jgi:cytochrome c oxidase subunit 3
MNTSPEIHRDDLASKTGMWFFLFTEMLLFGGLFVVYSVYRYRNGEAFHLAAQELNVAIGTVNTILLLISSTTIAMSITAIQTSSSDWLFLQTNILSGEAILKIIFIRALLFLFYVVREMFFSMVFISL